MTSSAAERYSDVRIVPEWEFQDRLKRSLRLVGLSVGELAHILDVDPNTVGRWTNGHTMPNKATRMILANLTGVDLEWLENGTAPAEESTGASQRARRDSNPKPSVLERGHLALVSSVRVTRTPKLVSAEARTRRLRSVS